MRSHPDVLFPSSSDSRGVRPLQALLEAAREVIAKFTRSGSPPAAGGRAVGERTGPGAGQREQEAVAPPERAQPVPCRAQSRGGGGALRSSPEPCPGAPHPKSIRPRSQGRPQAGQTTGPHSNQTHAGQTRATSQPRQPGTVPALCQRPPPSQGGAGRWGPGSCPRLPILLPSHPQCAPSHLLLITGVGGPSAERQPTETPGRSWYRPPLEGGGRAGSRAPGQAQAKAGPAPAAAPRGHLSVHLSVHRLRGSHGAGHNAQRTMLSPSARDRVEFSAALRTPLGPLPILQMETVRQRGQRSRGSHSGTGIQAPRPGAPAGRRGSRLPGNGARGRGR